MFWPFSLPARQYMLWPFSFPIRQYMFCPVWSVNIQPRRKETGQSLNNSMYDFVLSGKQD